MFLTFKCHIKKIHFGQDGERGRAAVVRVSEKVRRSSLDKILIVAWQTKHKRQAWIDQSASTVHECAIDAGTGITLQDMDILVYL